MTGDAPTAIVLFDCAPLHARLTRAACAARYKRANERGDWKRSLPLVESCSGCNVGLAHMRGEPTPASFEREESGFDPLYIEPRKPKNFGTTRCAWCGRRFERTNPTARFCSVVHKKRFHRFALKPRHQRPKGLWMDDQPTQPTEQRIYAPRRCVSCRDDFSPKTPNAKQCDSCKEARAEAERERALKARKAKGKPKAKVKPKPKAPAQAAPTQSASTLASASEVLQLAGFNVRVLRTPAGELLQVK